MHLFNSANGFYFVILHLLLDSTMAQRYKKSKKILVICKNICIFANHKHDKTTQLYVEDVL